MAKNSNLENAKRAKKDEFYMQLDDIAQELRRYRDHFKGKVVFCNCDDPYESNFFKYFALNFNALGLKKLVATCYDGSPITGNELLLQFDTPESELRELVRELMKDSDVQSKSGIYWYVFDGDERHLDIRAFDGNTKREVYERQKGVCPMCGKHFELEEMEADHIKPWKDGGRTIADNCQMLCREDNRRKGAK